MAWIARESYRADQGAGVYWGDRYVIVPALYVLEDGTVRFGGYAPVQTGFATYDGKAAREAARGIIDALGAFLAVQADQQPPEPPGTPAGA